jgi:CBS-domain-containing membrane protein
VPGVKGPGAGGHWLRRIFPPIAALELLASFLGAVVGMATVAALHYQILLPRALAMVIGSFAASAVLLYGLPAAPLAQPRNVLGGHMLSALVGVAVRMLIVEQACESEPHCFWVGCALAVGLAIFVMQLTATMHPPGGATAFIAVASDASVNRLGFMYVLLPAGAGAAIMMFVALITNNLFPQRRYPQYWW